MRYYDIDKINSENNTNKYKWPVIWAIISLLFSAGLFVFIMDQMNDTIASALEAEEEAVLQEGAKSAHDTDLGSTLRELSVDQVVEGEELKTYSISEIRQLDVSKPSGVTVADLKLVTKGNFVGLEEAFWQAEQDYGINCLFVMAIGANESAYGTICFRKNNMFGFGRSGFATKEECIDTVSRTLATRYLDPSGSLYHGSTIDGVHKRYAASSTWDDHVAKYMVTFYDKIAPSHNEAIEALK